MFVLVVLLLHGHVWGSSWQRKETEGTPQKTISDADYADDIAILANTPNQAETLLHSLERAGEGIGLYVNAHKTEYIYIVKKNANKSM